jgi:hypothetical protein
VGSGGAPGSGGANGTGGGVGPSCTGWGAAAAVCQPETAGFTYICNCPGYEGCQFRRFADLTCSSCSPYGCGYFATNGTMYGPIGNDPRPASCACTNVTVAACTGDLSNIGAGNFRIDFTLTTTTQVRAAVINQRTYCFASTFWGARVEGNGQLLVETDDGSPGHQTIFTSNITVNDGSPHAVTITRISGLVEIRIDGRNGNSAQSLASFGSLPPLRTLTDPCSEPVPSGDGTVPFVGTLTGICVAPL